MKSGHMKIFQNVLLIGFLGVFATGCMYPGGRPDYTGSGALSGAATGAAIGAMASQSGEGALIGGAIGAIAGGLIGHGMDAQQEARIQAQAPQTYARIQQNEPLSVADVKELARAGVSDELIISQIRNSRTIYRLSTAEIIGLKDEGVSENIIDFMINTQTQTPSEQYAAGPTRTAQIPETIYVAPRPGLVWIGGAWMWPGYHGGGYRGYWHRPYRPYHHGHYGPGRYGSYGHSRRW